MNRSWRQHPTKQQLYGYQSPITKTINVRRSRHAGHSWRSRNKLISDLLQWTPTYGWTKAGRPARPYIQQLCEDTGYSPEDLLEAMHDREKWRERVKDICASGTTCSWWFVTLSVTGFPFKIIPNAPITIFPCTCGNSPHDWRLLVSHTFGHLVYLLWLAVTLLEWAQF